jgi:ABC-type phosphate transport system auxiliary subunit
MFCHLVTFSQQEFKKTVVILNGWDSILHQIISSRISELEEEKSIEIEETKGLYKLSFWHFAPGMHYDFINNNYYISVSTSALVNHFTGKRQEKKRLSAIDRRHKIKITSEEARIKSKLASIQKDIENAELSKKILDNDDLIYKIKEQQYQNNEIDAETFLREKSSILNKIKIHNTLILSIEKEILELQDMTSHEIQIDLKELYFDVTNY